jgi:hypothetical protein
MLIVHREDGSRTLARRGRLALWFTILALSAAMLAYRIWQTHHHEAADARYNAHVKVIEQSAQAAMRKMNDLANRGSLDRRQLEDALNGGQPFTNTRVSGPLVEAKWNDPVSNRPFHFTFYNDALTGWGTTWGTVNYPPPPGPTRAEQTVEELRRWFAGSTFGVGPALWIALLATAIASRRWRDVLLQLTLATAVLCAMAWLIHPNYPLNAWGIVRNDSLFWAIVLLIASGIALAMARLARRMPRPTTARCPACDYDLTGNVSGVCPECGAPVPADVAWRVSIGP